LQTYLDFQGQADKIKNNLLEFLIDQKKQGKKVAAYGAAAKGNTLLNYAGVKSDLLPFVCDAASAKQGKFLPGSHIPILSPDQILAFNPDYVLILPWNISGEIKIANDKLVKSGSIFVTVVPELKLI
jgi:ABC-type Fe3+-hydroxamate transport system substrate-binding protein